MSIFLTIARQKVKGNMFLHVLIMLMLVLVLCSIFFYIINYYSLQVKKEVNKRELIRQTTELLKYSPHYFRELERTPEWAALPEKYYSNPNIQFDYKKKLFGFNEIFQLRAIAKADTFNRICKYGYLNEITTGLYLAEGFRSLNYAGEALIDGNAYLPARGDLRSHIENKAPKNKKLVTGKIKTSEKKLPEMYEKFIKTLQVGNLEPGNNDDAVTASQLDRDTIHNSFEEKTLFLNYYSISGNTEALSGNIVIYSPDSVLINNSNLYMEDVVIFAPVIRFNCSSVSAGIQLIALNELTVMGNGVLDYHSIIGMSGEATRLRVEEEVHINGDVFVINNRENDLKKEKNKNYSFFDKNVVVNGNILGCGQVDLRGIVNGILITDQLVVHTQTGTYDHHILDGRMLPGNIKNGQLSLLPVSDKTEILKWLN